MPGGRHFEQRSGRAFGAFLLTDMVKSTSLRNELGFSIYEPLNEWHHRLVAAAAERHGGTPFKETGDGQLVCFSSAASAIEAAVDMQRAVAEFAQPRRGGRALEMRIGISVGDVDWVGDDATGDALIEAARLEEHGPDGGIAVSDLTYQLGRARAEVEFGEPMEIDAPGLGRIPYVPVIWQRAGEAPAALDLADPGNSLDRFVGRSAQLDELDKLWSTLGTGRRLVMVEGEAGIGKTELARAFARRVHQQGRWVLQGRCDGRDLVPFQPFAAMLEHLLEHAPARSELREAWSHELAPVLPGLGPARLGGERYQVFEGVSSFLEMLSLGHPVLLVVDDIGVADGQTLELLEYILRRPGDGSLMIIATTRGLRSEQTEQLGAFRNELDHARLDVETLTLEGMKPDAVGQLLEQETNLPAAMCHGTLAEYLAGYTGGNPLNLKAVAATLTAETAEQIRSGLLPLDRPPIDIPTAVVEDMQAVHDRLDDATRSVVEAAAVIGFEFDRRLLRRVTDLGDRDLDAALASAISYGVIVDLGPHGGFRFGHPLVHDAVVQILGFRAGALHARVGRALMDLYGSRADRYAAELSGHLRFSDERPDREAAARYAERAGAAAAASFAHNVGASQYGLALSLLRDLGDLTPQREFELLLDLGRCQRHSGAPQARETLEAAAEIAFVRDDGMGAAAAILASQTGQWSQIAEVDDARITLIDRAIALLDEQDVAARATLMAAKAVELVFTEDPEDGAVRDQLSREALDLVPDWSDPETRYKVLELREGVLRPSGSLPERLAIISELEERTDDLSPAQLFGTASMGFWTAIEASATEARKARLERIRSINRAIDHPRLRCMTSHWEGVEAALSADMEAALDRASTTFHMMKALGEPDAPVWYIGARFVPYRSTCRLDELVDDLEARIAAAPQWVSMRAGLALAHASTDEPDRAREVLSTIPVDRLIGSMTHHDRIANMALVAETLAILGDHPDSARLCDELARWERHIAFNGSACFGAVDHYRGLLLVSLDRVDEAVDAFALAVEQNRSLEAPALTAESQVELAASLLAAGERGDLPTPSELIANAQAVATRHELDLVARRCRELA